MRNPARIIVAIVFVLCQGAHAFEVTVSGDDALVGNRTVHVVQIVAPPEVGDTLIRHPERRLIASAKCDAQGEVKVDLEPGRYVFRVLYRKGDTVVNLSSGRTDVLANLRVGFGETRERDITAPDGAVMTECLFRVRGVPMKKEQRRGFWEFNPKRTMIRETIAAKSFKLIDSADEHTPIRVVYRKGDARTVLWIDTAFDYDNHTAHKVTFRYVGPADDYKRIADAKYSWLLPEMDEFTFDLKKEPTFYTNRVWIEGYHGYDIGASELSFNVRSRVLEGDTVIPWGGPVKPYAYARRMMKWAKPNNEIVWGAYLATEHNDVLNTLAEPDKMPAVLRPEQISPKAKVDWKVDLVYTGEGSFPEVRPYGVSVSKDQIEELFADIDALEKELRVKIAYRIDGHAVDQELSLTPFVTHRTPTLSFEAPRHWAGRVNCYMAKLKFVSDICEGYRITGVDRIQLFFTKNWGAGWTSTTAKRADKTMQMGFEDLRRRHSLYTVNELLTHEMLHAWGHQHGQRHNRTIKEAETILLYVRHTLADHPEYRPDPVTQEFVIESAKHDGSHKTTKQNHPKRTVQ